MKKLISAKTAGTIMIIMLTALVAFHVLVLFRIVPYEIVWAGQIDDASSLLIFEGMAMAVTIAFILIIAFKIGYMHMDMLKLPVAIGVWFMFVFFFLNTIGNLTSGVSAEKLIFTPVTIVLTVLAYRLAIEK